MTKMSKLKELIRELCPDGVSFILIKDLMKQKAICIITPAFKIKKNDYKESGSVPIISQEQEFISGYCERTDTNIPQKNYVCFGDHSECIKYVDFAFVQGADGLKIMYTNEGIILARFLYHAALAYYRRHNNYERHFKYLSDTAIPLPPLPVQREIVRILDKFTELIAELTAELTARKKQYEFYRDKLLRFDSDAPIYTIGELCTVVTGGEPPADCIKGDVSDSTHPYPVWGNGKEVYGYSGACKIDRDAVVISSIGANTGAVYYRKAFFTPIIRLKVVMPNDDKLNARFLFHALSATEIKSKSSSVPNMNANEIKAIKIPVPSLEVQKRLVYVLDNFDAICSDLKIGLPAEIEARKKQYEFYREKLLAFHEISN